VRALGWFFVWMGPVIVALAILYGLGATTPEAQAHASLFLALALIVTVPALLLGILILAIRRPRRRTRHVRRYGGDWDEFDEWDSRRKEQ
jgi:hypothetical protein